jgi:hypothetical protein
MICELPWMNDIVRLLYNRRSWIWDSSNWSRNRSTSQERYEYSAVYKNILKLSLKVDIAAYESVDYFESELEL